MIDGLQAHPCELETEGTLGQQPWHDDLLRAVFTLSYLQGYILANEYPLANYDAAYRFIIQRFQSDLHQNAGIRGVWPGSADGRDAARGCDYASVAYN